MAKNSDPATTNTAREDLKRKTPDSSVYSVRSIQEDVDDPAKALDPFAPSSEELLTLRRVPGRLPWTAYTLAFVEMCERLSFCGTVAVC